MNENNKPNPATTIAEKLAEVMQEAIAARVHVEMDTVTDAHGKLQRYELRLRHKGAPDPAQYKDTHVVILNVPIFIDEVPGPDLEWEVWCDGQRIDTETGPDEWVALRKAVDKRPGLRMHLSVIQKQPA